MSVLGWAGGASVAAPAGFPAPAPAPAAPATAQAVGPAVGVASVAAAAEPVSIRLAGLGVDAPVRPVGVDARGGMAVPDDVRSVGWYRFGPAPGAAGSSVLAGHVDDRLQGHGAFYRLGELSAGDEVRIGLADGAELRFRVTALERVDKDRLPVQQLFARTGPPRLTLVTCGGEFDRARGTFRDNVVVHAVPAP